MLALITLSIVSQAKPAFDFDLRNGLTVRVNGIPVISGAGIQYYEDGWHKGYYSTHSESPKVTQIDSDTLEATLAGYSGLVSGSVRYHRAGNHLQVHYDLRWSGPEPAKVEANQALLSAPAVEKGTLTVDGTATRSLTEANYPNQMDMTPRRYGADAKEFVFDGPLVRLKAVTSSPTTLFDARGYDQDYADGKSVLWMGELGLDVSKDKPLAFDVDWEITPKPVSEPKTATINLVGRQATVVVPDSVPDPIVPHPTTNELKYSKLLDLKGKYDFPAGHVRFWESEFLSALKQRFEPAVEDKTAAPVHVDGGVSKLGFHPGGYQISITGSSISVLGEEDEGLHNGLKMLARLAVPHDGHIALPTGYLSSNPQIPWRGVHLFVGPEAPAFHRRLWERVLLPLGFNKVVLQCERTQWDCAPNLKLASDTMTKGDLAELFSWYRSKGVEPIPLIQSFGHMEWLFRGGANKELAVNPDVPYTIDPRNSGAQQLLKSLWTEAADLLKPDMIHFGCDEVDMRGFPPNSSALTTELWEKQIPFLADIAKSHGAKMMLWGDMALARGEAIDAYNADSVETAVKRRGPFQNPHGSPIGTISRTHT